MSSFLHLLRLLVSSASLAIITNKMIFPIAISAEDPQLDSTLRPPSGNSNSNLGYPVLGVTPSCFYRFRHGCIDHPNLSRNPVVRRGHWFVDEVGSLSKANCLVMRRAELDRICDSGSTARNIEAWWYQPPVYENSGNGKNSENIKINGTSSNDAMSRGNTSPPTIPKIHVFMAQEIERVTPILESFQAASFCQAAKVLDDTGIFPVNLVGGAFDGNNQSTAHDVYRKNFYGRMRHSALRSLENLPPTDLVLSVDALDSQFRRGDFENLFRLYAEHVPNGDKVVFSEVQLTHSTCWPFNKFYRGRELPVFEKEFSNEWDDEPAVGGY